MGMPHPNTSAILQTAVDRWDLHRMTEADQWIHHHLLDYGVGRFGSRESLIEVRNTGGVQGLELDTLSEAIYRVDYGSFKSEYLAKAPAVWLLQSLWWVLHPELPEEWLDLTYQMDAWRRHDPREGLYPQQLIAMLDEMFQTKTVSHDVLASHLRATYQPEDRLALLAGTPWAVGHLYWPALVLYYRHNPGKAGRGHVSMSEGTAALFLADLHEQWLPGPWHETRRRFRDIEDRARQAEQKKAEYRPNVPENEGSE